MKKTIIIFSIIFCTILLVVYVSLTQNSRNIIDIQNENAEYEKYKDKELFGTEVASIINKVINENIKNGVIQDEKGLYISNNTNSINVEIKLKNEEELQTYKMETIAKVGTSGFVKNFNLILFKCTSIDYHKQTGRIAKIVFEQIEE